jgi:hypothetical protein
MGEEMKISPAGSHWQDGSVRRNQKNCRPTLDHTAPNFIQSDPTDSDDSYDILSGLKWGIFWCKVCAY